MKPGAVAHADGWKGLGAGDRRTGQTPMATDPLQLTADGG